MYNTWLKLCFLSLLSLGFLRAQSITIGPSPGLVPIACPAGYFLSGFSIGAWTCTLATGGTVGGSSGQVNWNNSGASGGFTFSQDLSLATSTGVATVMGLQARAVASTAPTDQQVLQWNAGASQWQPATISTGSPAITAVSGSICTSSPFSADKTGVADAVSALTSCFASLAPGGANASSMVIVPPGNYLGHGGTLPTTGVLHGKIWIQTGASCNGCAWPLSTTNVWVQDDTVSDLTVYGSLFLPNTTSFLMQTFQPCDTLGECAAITTDNYAGATEASPNAYIFDPASRPPLGALNAAGSNMTLSGGLSTGNAAGGAVSVATYDPGVSGGVRNSKTVKFQITPAGNAILTPGLMTSGPITPAFLYTAPAHTGVSNTAFQELNFNMAAVLTFVGGGTVAGLTDFSISPRTYETAAATVQTLTQPASMTIGGPPACNGIGATSLTCTNPIGLWIKSNNVLVSGAVVANAYGLQVDAPTGATTGNQAAYLNGPACVGSGCAANLGGSNITLLVDSTTTSTCLTVRAYASQNTAVPLLRVASSAGTDMYHVDLNGLVTMAVGTALSISSNILAPVNEISHVGSGLIKTITVPAGFTTGCIYLLPDTGSPFTTDATGNIAIASTGVQGRMLMECYDGAKWYPSY